MTPFTRFLAFEMVGWLVAVLVLWIAVDQEFLTVGWAIGLFAVWVVKDFALYPLTKRAYEHGPTHGAHELIGSEVVVEQALEPEGYVRAGNERWRARVVETDAESSGAGLQVGALARVVALEGISLVVEAAVERPRG